MVLALKDQQAVVKYLGKLKKAEPEYPSELFALRREGYLRRVSEISAGSSIGSRLKNRIKTGSTTTRA